MYVTVNDLPDSTDVDRLPREGEDPPSTPISRRCSSSQTRNDSEGIQSGFGLEDSFDGLEEFPGSDEILGAFDVFDYSKGGGPVWATEDVASGHDPAATGGEAHEEEEEEDWVGVPIPGQFPLSNFLADKLSTTRGGTENYLSPGRPAEAQVANLHQSHLDLDQSMVLDLNSSLLPNSVDPRTGLLSLPPKEQNRLAATAHSETISLGHQTQPRFVCGTCGKSFSAQSSLDIHSKRHKKNHCCQQCDWRFSEARDLRRHVQSVHQQQWERCSQCRKKLKKRGDNIRRHMMRYCKYKQQDSDS
ncbi:hypothetical protein GGS26DRAFT_597863 [Hypomontagnella submonticulosa]|nr:hypothetical protein GGS26DRAFT_597863 [Hypomontagnella submonticulosa]